MGTGTWPVVEIESYAYHRKGYPLTLSEPCAATLSVRENCNRSN